MQLSGAAPCGSIQIPGIPPIVRRREVVPLGGRPIRFADTSVKRRRTESGNLGEHARGAAADTTMWVARRRNCDRNPAAAPELWVLAIMRSEFSNSMRTEAGRRGPARRRSVAGWEASAAYR